MLFNSLSFALFLPIVFLLYWFVLRGRLRAQNMMLLAASYYFYSCWDWRFLFLLMFSTLLDYYTGLKMEDASTDGRRKFWFWLSVVINLGFLGVFKYYNFFAESFAAAVAPLGWKVSPFTLSVILPVGISFYTFHGLSYVIDIYKKRIAAERNFVDYALFVSFFPLLVAGPIERATHLLPQIKRERQFDYAKAVDGMRQILWGLFKKVVVADGCAEYANLIFNNYEQHNGATLALGAVLFAFQIYGDFSGYSDIALGTARLFGVELLRNFAYPYFSRDMAEFWRRWHISLSTWFRDYLYIPLGGSKGGKWMQVRNTFIIFLVSGFWHGANWTFIVWGGLNALFIMPSVIRGTNRQHLEVVAQNRALPTLKELGQMLVTFALTVVAWVFFRSASVGDAWGYLERMVLQFASPAYKPFEGAGLWVAVAALAFMLLMEWRSRRERHALEAWPAQMPAAGRWLGYGFLCIAVLLSFGAEQAFIYFQF